MKATDKSWRPQKQNGFGLTLFAKYFSIRTRIAVSPLCGFASSAPGGAGYTISFLLPMGDITIPIDGGTVPFHSSRGFGGATQTVDATIVGAVAKN